MKPISFPEQNIIFGADQPEYQPLPAFVGVTNEGKAVTCWRLTWKERLRIVFTGRLWLQMLTFHRPLTPVFLTADKSEVFKPLFSNTRNDLYDFSELDMYLQQMLTVSSFSSFVKKYWAEDGSRHLLVTKQVGLFSLAYKRNGCAIFVLDTNYQSADFSKYDFERFTDIPM